MGIDWGTVVIGFVCTCIGLWAGWGIYHRKVGLLRMEIKVLKRTLSDERGRGEAYGKAADEWRGASMRADAEVERLKHETDKAIAELKQKLHDAEMRADLAEAAETERKIDYDKLKSEADKTIDHQTYKRCVARAQEWRSYAAFCGMQSSCHNHRGFGKTAEKWTWKECHAWKCVKRWLGLAEQVKEDK